MGSMVIQSITVVKNLLKAYPGNETSLNALPRLKNDGNFNFTEEEANGTWNMGVVTDIFYGASSNVQGWPSYCDLTGYDELRVYLPKDNNVGYVAGFARQNIMATTRAMTTCMSLL